jgi:tRNA pseudouridine55 synthase
VADLGDAYCEQLERTAVGPFRLEQADRGRLLAPEEALLFLPERALDAEEARAVGHGRRIAAEREGGTDPGHAGRVAAEEGALRLSHAGEVLAIAERRGEELQPVVVFRPR